MNVSLILQWRKKTFDCNVSFYLFFFPQINGEYTILENIADNGGIKLAYLAYNYWSSLNKQEPLLPGLEHFSSNQMFWINAAQALCSVERAEFAKILLNVDNHSPSEFRVIGSFQNMKEFSDVFKCALESPMNQKKKMFYLVVHICNYTERKNFVLKKSEHFCDKKFFC